MQLKLKYFIHTAFALLISFTASQTYAGHHKKGEKKEGEWVALFNGKDFTGWTQRGGEAKYEVRDGMVVGTSVLNTPNSFMCTNKLYSDFELTFEVKCGKINSGVQIRSQENEKKQVNGPQVEIEQGPGQSGFIYGEKLKGGWRSPEPKSKDNSVNSHHHFKNNDWNQYRVIAKGANIKTYINGALIADLTDEEVYKTHPKGFIGLQVHKHKVADIEIFWRNIKLREF